MIKHLGKNVHDILTDNKQNSRLLVFKGLAHYQGDLEEFLPYLILGQFTHVGKGCVFGLGEYGLSWK